MFDNDFAIVIGERVQFDKPEKNLTMVYYGIVFNHVFIGVGILSNKIKPAKILFKSLNLVRAV